MGLRAATQRLRQRLAGNAGAPSAIVPGWAPGIYDGVPYGQPAMLPEHLKNELQRTNQMKKYLQEAARDHRFQFDTPGRGPDDVIILQVTEDPYANGAQARVATSGQYARPPARATRWRSSRCA